MANSLTAEAIHEQLLSLANAEIAKHSQRFFKTGAGEYGEGDQFLEICVPVLRQQVTRYQQLPDAEVIHLLQSPFHEERLFALLVWVKQFQKASEEEQVHLYDLYLSHTQYINNWDLVDSSAYQKDLRSTPPIPVGLGGGVTERDRREQNLHFIC